MIAEVITWTLLNDEWPEPGDCPMSLIVSEDGEEGPEFRVEDGCTCFSDSTDEGDHLREITWFEDANGIGIVGQVHAWTYGPTGKPVIDALAPKPPSMWGKQPSSLIPFESDLS